MPESCSDIPRTAAAALPSEYCPPGTPTVRLICISDTHGHHAELLRFLHKDHPALNVPPATNILIHAGDFSRQGKKKDLLSLKGDFLDKLGPSFRHVVVVNGNHDFRAIWSGETRGVLTSNNYRDAVEESGTVTSEPDANLASAADSSKLKDPGPPGPLKPKVHFLRDEFVDLEVLDVNNSTESGSPGEAESIRIFGTQFSWPREVWEAQAGEDVEKEKAGTNRTTGGEDSQTITDSDDDEDAEPEPLVALSKILLGGPSVKTQTDPISDSTNSDNLKLNAPIDVLISHGPPQGYGDLPESRTGCPSLRKLIDDSQKIVLSESGETSTVSRAPSLVVCGHIHTARGWGSSINLESDSDLDADPDSNCHSLSWVNAASMSREKEHDHPLSPPIVVEMERRGTSTRWQVRRIFELSELPELVKGDSVDDDIEAEAPSAGGGASITKAADLKNFFDFGGDSEVILGRSCSVRFNME